MLEKVILILEKKGYSWDLRYHDKEKKDILMLSYHSKEITNLDNFMESYHIYSQMKEERFRYFFGKGPKEMSRISKSEILSKMHALPKNK